jgi:hypothetical protein
MTSPERELLPSVRHPNLWADAQRELASKVPETAPRTRVHACWWLATESGIARLGGHGAVHLIFIPVYLWAIARRVRQGPPGGFVAIFRSGDDADRGDPPILVCEVQPDDLPSPTGGGEAIVVGELARNGALVVEIDGRRVLPIHNPAAPTFEERRTSSRLFSSKA